MSADILAWVALLLGAALLLLLPRIAPLPVTVLRSPFVIATVGAAVWSAAAGLVQLLRPDRPGTLVLAGLHVLGAWAVLVAGLRMATIVSYRGHLLTRRSSLLIWLPALVVVAMAATPSLSPLVVTEVVPGGLGPAIAWGPVFWVLTSSAAILSLAVAGTGVLAVVATVPGQRGTIVAAMAVLVPAATSLALFIVLPTARTWSMVPPIMFCLALVFWGRLGSRAPSLAQLPITASRVLSEVRDGVIVLTPDGSVLETNAAARDLLCPGRETLCSEQEALTWQDLTGLPLTQLSMSDAPLTITSRQGREVELLVDSDGGAGGSAALVVAARDVTELAELRRHLADVASHDPMTGARNRRYLDDRLPELITASGADRPLSVVMLDIDLFKMVNDSHGHGVGDRVIIAIADEAAAALPPDGDLVRTGGDEFLLLLPGLDEAAAGQIADRVRQNCSDLRFATNGSPVQVTVSAGVARLRPGMGPDALVSAADRALYRAKAAGRDVIRS
jgi:diguanylate cyclase (GGDEF)-like protein